MNTETERATRYQKGLTIIEMFVAISLFTVASALISSFIVYGYRNHMRVNEEALATDRVNINIQVMMEEIRKATAGEDASFALTAADEDEVKFFSDIDRDGAAESVYYYMDGDELKKDVIEPTGVPPTYPPANAVTSTIAVKIIENEDGALFTYYGIDPLGEGNNVLLTYPIDIQRIRLIKVMLRTGIGDTDRERVVSSQVLIRNLREF